jgi:hypothetical protein
MGVLPQEPDCQVLEAFLFLSVAFLLSFSWRRVILRTVFAIRTENGRVNMFLAQEPFTVGRTPAFKQLFSSK